MCVITNGEYALLSQKVLKPQPGQEVKVELYDKDMDKDDFLGR